MEHPFFINGTANRSESMRWLTIAEKLLSNRDLFGSKSFATRVRDSDPNSLPADQILAIVDTLVAGDKRINNQHLDWYAILQVPPNQTHDSELIANQYRRLALVLNPQKNNYPFTDQAFRLVVDAWSVLSNPLRKSFYDKELGFFVNLASPTSSNNVSFMQSNEFSSIPVTNRGQSFVSHEHEPITNTNISFGRDRASPPVNFLSGDTPQGPQGPQPVTFLSNSSRDQQQPVTFSIPEQTQPVNSVPSSINFEQQPATFVSRDQPQQLNFLRSSNSEQQQFSFGSSSTIGQQQQQPVASVEQQGHERRDEDLVGNNQNQSAGISNNASNVKEKKGKVDVPSSTIPSFWTACPYCYLMYEYPLDYEDCTLRCQNCRRAFQAVNIPSPPPIVDGKEASFCCWGFMPLGFSVEIFERNRANISSWSPFSPMFTCPESGGKTGGSNVNNPVRGQSSVDNFGSSNSAGGPGSGGGRKHSAPRIYADDDEFLEISESSEQSDEDWNGDKKRKKGKSSKVKSARTGTGTPTENAKKQQAEKGKNVKGDTDTNMQDGLATQGGVEIPNVVAAEPSKRGVASKTRRQSGSVAKHFGKLDLNVEFSNEVEVRAPGRSQGYDAGTEEDDNVEVIGFFEGLDEFLSGLHIVNTVGDDGVRAA